MPNSKIAKIVANIEYRKPAGALEEYKYGVKIKRQAPEEQRDLSPDIFETSIKDLQSEMKKPIANPKLPEVELLDV